MSHYINELFDRLEHYEEIIDRLEAALKQIANTAGSQKHKQIAREALRNEAKI